MGNNEIGRLLHGSSKQPDFNKGTTSAIFHAFGNVEVLNELFIMHAITDSMVGKLSLRTLAVILSWPGTLFKDKPLKTFPTSCSVTSWNWKSSGQSSCFRVAGSVVAAEWKSYSTARSKAFCVVRLPTLVKYSLNLLARLIGLPQIFGEILV